MYNFKYLNAVLGLFSPIGGSTTSWKQFLIHTSSSNRATLALVCVYLMNVSLIFTPLLALILVSSSSSADER